MFEKLVKKMTAAGLDAREENICAGYYYDGLDHGELFPVVRVKTDYSVPFSLLDGICKLYKKMTIVVETNRQSDVVTVIDKNGELWEFYGVEDWFVGDYCLLTFIDSGIRGYMWDDEIISTIYRGWNEDFE